MTQYNKVIYDGNTLIDLTGDTVDAGSLLKGTTAHDRSGAQINGTLDPVYQDAVATVYDSTDASQFPVASGDLRMHDGLLYEANQAISTAESWTAAHWTAVTVEEVVDDVAATIPTVPTNVSAFTNDAGYTTNTGTVTSVATGSGLSGGPITGSGTISHSNSVTAQSTQAVYPIEIDAQGHISGYGSAVTSMPASDVSSWAKAANKPSYTASEVGALPDTTTIPSLPSDIHITADTTDLTAGTSPLTTGYIYLVYE